MSDIKFKATVDSKKGEVSLKKLDSSVTNLEKKTRKAGAGFKSLAVGVAAGVAAFAVATKALRGLIRWMGDAVDKAAVQQAAEHEVRAALESTGREVEANTEHFKLYASEIQNATTFGDEQILSAQALMIQLTELDQKGLDAATKGAIGLASVYKTDLKSATTLVGKALAGNFSALSRYGFIIDRTATAEEKRASLLSQLLVMYQRAEAEVDTYQGAVKQLSNVYGDLKEEVGKSVTENEEFRDVLKELTVLTKDLIDSGLVEWVTDIAVQAVKSAPMMRSLAESLTLVLMIYKLQAEKQGEINETQVEWMKNLQLNDALQIKLRGDIAGVIEATEEQSRVIKENIEVVESQLGGLDNWGQKILSLTGLYEGLQDTMTSMDWPSALPEPRDMEGVLEGAQDTLDSYGGAFDKTFKEMTESQKSFSAVAIGEFLMMEASVKGFVGALMNTFEQWAIGQIIPTIMAALPFPANLLATGGAILAIKAIFAGIRGEMETQAEGKAEGGWVGLHGTEIIKVGERGPEFLTPNHQIQNITNQGARRMDITIIVRDQLDPYTAQRITRQQIIPQILDALDINEHKKKFQERLGIG